MIRDFVDSVKHNVLSFVDWGMTLYHRLLKSLLDLSFAHTYDSNPDEFIRSMNLRFFHRSDDILADMLQTSPLNVIGPDEVDAVARRRIRYRGLLAASCTMLTMIPLSWITWPLMIVDIVFFQYQVFLLSIELHILYRPRDEYAGHKFDYSLLANVAVRMEGTHVKHKIIRNAKRGVGWTGRWLASKSIKAFRLYIQTLIRQILKWMGVTVTKETVAVSMAYLLSFVCAFIGGLITFWMFLPMGKRLRLELRDK